MAERTHPAQSTRRPDLAGEVRAVVDSFTAPDGTFIEDVLTRDEYDRLRAALEEDHE